MKVLLVSPLPPPMGGIATLTERIINNLSSSEIEFECINVAHKVNESNDYIVKYGKIESIIILRRTLVTIFIRCIKKECDIIHVNSSSGDGTLRDYLIQKIAKKFNIPVIIQYHCNLEDSINGSRIAKKICRRCFKLASRIIVLNESSQKFIKERGYNSLIVPNGIPENLLASEHSINECIKNVVFTGRVSELKGCRELYECAKINPNIIFNLAGLINEELGKKMCTLNNIKLFGALQHNEVIALLDKADVFIFPTYSEGFSVSLLEAMARGVPCITTGVGANQAMIENKGGVIVETKNAEAVIKALKEISEPSVREKMSIWNIKKVSDFYTEEKMYKKFLSIYREIVSNKSSNNS